MLASEIEDGTRLSREAERPHVVLLVHGIRTQGEWQQRVKEVLEQEPGLEVVPTRFEFFDLPRFLLPFPFTRERPVERIHG